MPAQAWVTLIVGTIATVGVLVTWRQKNNADNRAEWWRRTAWAIERTFSDNNAEAELGFLMLTNLLDSKLVTKSEAELIQLIAEQTAFESEDEADEGVGGDVGS